MEQTELLQLWQSYNHQLEEQLSLNRKNTWEITQLKVQSFISSMTPVKIIGIITGILWVLVWDVILINTFSFASVFFIVSMGIQVLVTKIAIIIYLYQLILIYQTDISQPIIATQERIARLQSSTLWSARVLFLQLPAWTTFFWSSKMFTPGNLFYIILQIGIALLFTAAAIWLFININIKNKDRKWFRFIFTGREWKPIVQSMEILEQVKDYKQD